MYGVVLWVGPELNALNDRDPTVAYRADGSSIAIYGPAARGAVPEVFSFMEDNDRGTHPVGERTTADLAEVSVGPRCALERSFDRVHDGHPLRVWSRS